MKKGTLRKILTGALVASNLAFASPSNAIEDPILEATIGSKAKELSKNKPWAYVEDGDRYRVVYMFGEEDWKIKSGANITDKLEPLNYKKLDSVESKIGIPTYVAKTDDQDLEEKLVEAINAVPLVTRKFIKRIVINGEGAYEIGDSAGRAHLRTGEVCLKIGKDSEVKRIMTHEGSHQHQENLDTIIGGAESKEKFRVSAELENMCDDELNGFARDPDAATRTKKVALLRDEVKKLGRSPKVVFEEEWNAIAHYNYGEGGKVVRIGSGYAWNDSDLKTSLDTLKDYEKRMQDYTPKFKELNEEVSKKVEEYEDLRKKEATKGADEMLADVRKIREKVNTLSKEVGEIAQKYNALAEKITEKTEGPRYGISGPYGSTAMREDIADMVSLIHSRREVLREFITPSSPKYDERIKKKVDLLLEYKFITPETHKALQN